ncbi:MAG: replicative DNA helicase [Deltaproteobacteria bacterium]|nr:replicative DNA helicase [Deltaproteobacteria bacterium]
MNLIPSSQNAPDFERNLLRRVPPHNLEIEQALLGAILVDNSSFNRALEILSSDGGDFYKEAHRKIFLVALELSEKNEPIDAITLAERLRTRNQLEEVGGVSYVALLTDNAAPAASVPSYAKIVKEKATVRQLIHVSLEIMTEGYGSITDVEEFLDRVEQKIFEISQDKIRPSFFPIRQIVKDSFRTIERLYEKKELVTGVPTGFTDFDSLTAGLQASDLVIVAGRPSMGKTSLCLNIAEYAAIEAKIPVVVFSLEMSKEQLALRMLCSQARVDGSRLRRGFLGEKDWPKLTRAAGVLSDAPIFIDDTAAISTLELRAKSRRLKSEKNIGLVIVDYLQLMRGSKSVDNREQEISEISRTLKALAKELRIPVVALSQLNRGVEQRVSRRPQLSDLRESGAIEQDADVIAFIYRDEVYKQTEENKGVAEVIVGKQRNGPTGIVKLAFFSEYSCFENLAPQGYPS